MKKFFGIILIGVLVGLPISTFAISAVEGDPCCCNSDCGDEGLICACLPWDADDCNHLGYDCKVEKKDVDGIRRTFLVSGTPGICVESGHQVVCPPIPPYSDIPSFINNLINQILMVVLPLATLMIVIGAFVFLTSGGQPKRVSLGKKIIIYTLVGIAIILFSKALISLIKAVL